MLLAQNEVGYLNLSALSSAAFVDVEPHEAPHAPWRRIVAHAEGLIVLTGGVDGPIDPLFAAGRIADGRAALDAMAEAFGDRLYVELQRHGLPAQAAAEPHLVAWAYERGVPLVATNDVHFAEAKTWRAHDALLCIADGAFTGQDDRRKVTAQHWFKPASLMRALFADLPEACDNTLEIARRCAFMVRKRAPILPRFPSPSGLSEEEELARQAREGLRRRLDASPPPPDGEEALLGAPGTRDRRDPDHGIFRLLS